MQLERLEILKDLILQYQKTQDPKIFEKILERIDKFLVYVVSKYLLYKFLDSVDSQDLYQTAVISLYKCLAAFPENEVPEKIPVVIAAYIKSEIRQTYPLRSQFERDVVSLDGKNKFYSDEEIYKNMDLSELREMLAILIHDNIITQDEFDLLVLHHVHKMPVGKIAKQFGQRYGYGWYTVDNKIKKVMKKIRKAFEEKDLL